MVVEIIKPGKTPEERNPKIRATCRKCSCQFTFQATDAAYVNDQRDGDYYQLPCPTCSELVQQSAKANTR